MSNTFQEYGINATVNDLGELSLHVVDKTVGQDAAGEFIGFLLEQYGLLAVVRDADQAEADAFNNENYEDGGAGAYTSSVPVEESTPAPAAVATREELKSFMDSIRRDVPAAPAEEPVREVTPVMPPVVPLVPTTTAKRRPARPRKLAA